MTRHAAIRLIESNCTACYICARECPSWCISIEAHAETVAADGAPAARRPRAKAVLDRFDLDFTDCIYCGLCIEECPFDALEWTDTPLPSATSRAGLTLTKEQLAALPPDGADGPR